jgi:hypothetical protein
MKKNIIGFILIMISSISFSQAPQKISYQAVIRDASNNLLSLKNIAMRISILKGTNNGAPVYIEMQQKQTNLNGLVSLQIGAGSTLMGKMKDIDWANGPYFVLTETDPDGGFDYRIIGSSELLSVPYALFSANSTGSIDTNYLHNSVISLQNQTIENKNNIQKNLDSIQANAAQIESNVNNIQSNTNNIKNNLDTLNSKISTVDFNALILGYQKVGKFVTSISLEGTDSFDIKINGNLIASKNVTIGGNIESLGATSTLGTLEKPFKGLFISSGSLSIASDTLGRNVPPAVLSNVRGNLQISAGGLKLLGDNSSLIAPRIISTLTGNASTATKLETAHTINGILFDGSSDIILPGSNTNSLTYTNIGTGDVPGGTFDGSVAKTISYNSLGAAPSAGSILITTVGSLTTGAIPYSLLTGIVPIWNQSTSGNAATASKLSTTKLINGVAFDGTADIIIASTSSNALTFNNIGTGDIPGETYNGSIAKSISYNTIGAVASNTAITASTKTKLTYDTKGLITAGTDATTADIGASTNKNYVTDIQSGVLSNTSGTNTGDESIATIKTKLGITILSGSNTGDETNATIKTKLGITTLSGSNTGDQILPTLESLGASPLEGSDKLTTTGLLSKLTLSSNKSEEQSEEIDLSKCIHKLSGISGRHYILKDGIEGQIIYITPFGDKTTFSDITIDVENGTIWVSNQLLTSNRERPVVWSPFNEKYPSKTMATAIFSENRWFITGGTSSY